LIRPLIWWKEHLPHTTEMGFLYEHTISTGILVMVWHTCKPWALIFWQFGPLCMHTPSTVSTVLLQEEHSLKRTMHISILY
jgi:hypothetical protein